MKKKLLTSLLIGTTLSGVVNSNGFALDNLSANSSVNGLSRISSADNQYTTVQKTYGSKIYYSYTLNDYPYYIFFLYDGNLYLYDKVSDCYLTGLITIRGHKFYFHPKTFKAQIGWYNTGGHRYYFNPMNFATLTGGFHTINNTRYLFSNDGYILTGLNKVNGETYYTNRVGAVVTGWYSLSNGDRYYFVPQLDGAAYTGWYRDLYNKDYMYFYEDGRMAKGIINIDGDIYLFLPHGSGLNYYRSYGYFSAPNGNRYYFDANNSGKAIKSKWIQTGRGWMYFNANGVMAKGVNRINGKTFVFTQSHSNDWNYYRATGWYTDKSTHKRYYFGGYEGEALTGKQYIDGHLYEFDQNGVLLIGY